MNLKLARVLSLFFIGIFIGSFFVPNTNSISVSYDDRLDQYKIVKDSMLAFMQAECAQSFKPALNILTRVHFSVTPLSCENLTISIRRSLHDDILTTRFGSLSDFKSLGEGWYEYDFDDISVMTEEEYFMVIKASPCESTLCWVNSDEDEYDRGTAYIHGKPYLDKDFCFKTFGYNEDNIPPNKPIIISGKTSGNVGVDYSYKTATVDDDDDEIWYLWDWDDDSESEWLGPFNSDDICEATHNWTVEDDYEIRVKARDEHGSESEWSDPLSVSMPKTKYISYNLLYLLMEKLKERFIFFDICF